MRLVGQPSERAVPDAIRRVGEALAEQYATSIQGILFYGSCLRMNTHQDSLVDCYVLVDDYTLAFQSWGVALLNRLLPPNVFYREVRVEDQVIRIKYAVLTLADYQKSVSVGWFHSYFWGRFCQPTVILFTATPEVREQILEGLGSAVLTFVNNVLPGMSSPFSAHDFWDHGLALSYGAELRSESSQRIQTLWDRDAEYYEAVLQVLLPDAFPGSSIVESADGLRYVYEVSGWGRGWNKGKWLLRRIQGKILSILRLMKAAYTFQGGVDYLLWKIERHSGVKVELTPAQRRHPIWAGLTTFWRLYRRGAFR